LKDTFQYFERPSAERPILDFFENSLLLFKTISPLFSSGVFQSFRYLDKNDKTVGLFVSTVRFHHPKIKIKMCLAVEARSATRGAYRQLDPRTFQKHCESTYKCFTC